MNAFLVDGVRTGIGSFGGSLSTVRVDDLAAHVLKELLHRNPNLDPLAIDDVILGCANQAGEDNRNLARMALLLAGMDQSIPGETLNRLCASGMAAAVRAAHAAHANEGEIFIAGGAENMTRGPWVLSKTSQPFGRDMQLFDSSFGWRFINPRMASMYSTDSMGETAENLASKYNISREDQDQFAAWSQEKASKHSSNLTKEITPIEVTFKKGETRIFDRDEFAKAGTTLEVLKGLKPAFRKDGTVTAGNSSGLNDGASAILIASESGLKSHNLSPASRIMASGVVGVEPKIMGIGPVGASNLALQRAGLTIDQMDIIELNEAFAAQVLACTRALGLSDNDSRLNRQGGAIALGHPLGMSGSRLLQSASLQLNETGGKYALCTMCIGVGQGYAVILENVR